MRVLLVAVLVQLTRAAEIKAIQVTAAGNPEALPLRQAGYVRREHRSQESSLAQLVPQPVSKVVEDATEAVSHLKSESTIGIWKEEEKQASTAMALSLLASLSFVLTVFYMWNTPALKVATRKILVSSISLFSVVLSFMVMKKVWKLIAGSESSSETKTLSDIFSFLRFFILYMLPSILRKRLEKQMDTDRIRAFQIVGVHLIGFAGADAFSDVLKLNVFSASTYGYFLGVCCMAALLGIMSWATMKIRTRSQTPEAAPLVEGSSAAEDATGEPTQAASATATPEGPVNQLLETMEVEIEGFVVGFLVSMWVRFTVTGALPGAKYGRQITGDDVSWLLCFCLAAFFFATLLAAYQARFPAASATTRVQYFLQRARRMLSMTTLMSFAWLAFFLCQWLLWHVTADGPNGSHHTAKLTASNALALLASASVFLPMMALNLVGKADWLLYSSEAFVKVAALVLGFSWETAVYMVVQGASESTEGEATKKLLGIATILLILLLILPGWYMHMLPEIKPSKEDQEQVPEEKAAEPAEVST
ncbi:unnamed protein product [Symbiodinium natans]|uniref:Uncharacterized protein n=1 Tax=Symbiodinium natans TaxID=878477 RepID=A0A812QRT2_9DINO|nr:unnamed protein product [Symbiodinium natans]